MGKSVRAVDQSVATVKPRQHVPAGSHNLVRVIQAGTDRRGDRVIDDSNGDAPKYSKEGDTGIGKIETN